MPTLKTRQRLVEILENKFKQDHRLHGINTDRFSPLFVGVILTMLNELGWLKQCEIIQGEITFKNGGAFVSTEPRSEEGEAETGIGLIKSVILRVYGWITDARLRATAFPKGMNYHTLMEWEQELLNAVSLLNDYEQMEPPRNSNPNRPAILVKTEETTVLHWQGKDGVVYKDGPEGSWIGYIPSKENFGTYIRKSREEAEHDIELWLINNVDRQPGSPVPPPETPQVNEKGVEAFREKMKEYGAPDEYVPGESDQLDSLLSGKDDFEDNLRITLKDLSSIKIPLTRLQDGIDFEVNRKDWSPIDYLESLQHSNRVLGEVVQKICYLEDVLLQKDLASKGDPEVLPKEQLAESVQRQLNPEPCQHVYSLLNSRMSFQVAEGAMYEYRRISTFFCQKCLHHETVVKAEKAEKAPIWYTA